MCTQSSSLDQNVYPPNDSFEMRSRPDHQVCEVKLVRSYISLESTVSSTIPT